MDLGLDGKVAFVAGGGSGLGLAVATELAAEGATVTIAGRDRGRLDNGLTQVRAAGGRNHDAVSLDVRDHDAVGAAVDALARKQGGLNVVVANAGGPPPGTATQFTVDEYRDAVELNLLAMINLVQRALPHLRDAGWGRILFVTSQSVKQPIPFLALSNTARAGILGYAKSLVADLGDAGITVNVLAPGSTRTARLEALAGDDVDAGLAAMAREIPLGRVGRPEEFAAAAVFLASERASFITGSVLAVDGGAIRSLS